jgi:hypothetical protein
MKKFILSLAVALATIASVNAAEVKGIVSSVDSENMMIMLQDESEYKIADGVSLEGIEEGTDVMIVTDDDGVATEILIAE